MLIGEVMGVSSYERSLAAFRSRLQRDIATRIAAFHFVEPLLRLLQPPLLFSPIDDRARPIGQNLRSKANAQDRSLAQARWELRSWHIDGLAAVADQHRNAALESTDRVEGVFHGLALQAQPAG